MPPRKFEDIQPRILGLQPGTIVRNWTISRKYLGDVMTVTKVGADFLIISAPNAKTLQRVPLKDFQKVWEIWPEYLSGKFKRNEMTELTRNSKYIISILHHLEVQK